MPGRRVASRAEPSPTWAAVNRRVAPSGAADSEYGLARVQPGPSRNRHWKNWPARTGIRRTPGPPTVTVVTPGPSARTATTRSGARNERHSGSPTRKTSTAPAHTAYRPHQKTVAAGGGQEVGAGPQLVRQGEPGAEVAVEVDEVPRLVAQPRGGPFHRGDHDHDQGGRAGDRQQHPGVVEGEVDDGAPQAQARSPRRTRG